MLANGNHDSKYLIFTHGINYLLLHYKGPQNLVAEIITNKDGRAERWYCWAQIIAQIVSTLVTWRSSSRLLSLADISPSTWIILYLSTSLAFGTTRYSSLILCISCTGSRSRYFSEGPRDPSSRYTHCYWRSLPLGSLSGRAGSVCILTTNTHISIDGYKWSHLRPHEAKHRFKVPNSNLTLHGSFQLNPLLLCDFRLSQREPGSHPVT